MHREHQLTCMLWSYHTEAGNFGEMSLVELSVAIFYQLGCLMPIKVISLSVVWDRYVILDSMIDYRLMDFSNKTTFKIYLSLALQRPQKLLICFPGTNSINL